MSDPTCLPFTMTTAATIDNDDGTQQTMPATATSQGTTDRLTSSSRNNNKNIMQQQYTLEDLLQACASITETALSCRTLQREDVLVTTRTNNLESSSSSLLPSLHDADNRRLLLLQQIQHERERAKWLDRLILEYESRTLKVAPSSLSLSPAALQERLIQASAARQFEHSLVSRAVVAQQARDIVFGSNHHNKRRPYHHHHHHPSSSLAARQLIHLEALQSRESLVQTALSQSRQLTKIRQHIQKIEQECQELRNHQAQLWYDLHHHHQQQQQQQDDADPNRSQEHPLSPRAALRRKEKPRENDHEKGVGIGEKYYQQQQRLAQKNRILKRIMLDLLTSSSTLDWSEDSRLRSILLSCGS